MASTDQAKALNRLIRKLSAMRSTLPRGLSVYADTQSMNLRSSGLSGGMSSLASISRMRLSSRGLGCRFSAQVNRWSDTLLARGLSVLTEAEMAAKSTDMPSEAIVERALIQIAQAARSARR